MLKRCAEPFLPLLLAGLTGVFVLAALAGCSNPTEPVLVDAVSTTTALDLPEVSVSTVPSTLLSDDPPSTIADQLDQPPLVVFDTDIGPDVDDVLALAMLHAYADRDMVEIAAVTVSRNSVQAALYTDAVNTFYGRPDIPIGIHKASYVSYNDNSLYTSTAGSWPHDLDPASVPDASQLLRRLLVDAEADGRRVIFIQTGFSGNLSALLQTEGDDITPRGGIELVADTVELLSVMAGSTDYGIVEFNIEKDIGNARYLFWKWPTKLILSPFELGYNIVYPYSSITSDFGWVDRHPVREAYEFSDLTWHQDAPPFYNMRSWDLTSVMYAVEPDAGHFRNPVPGRFTVAEDGRTTFTPGESGGSRVDLLLDGGPNYSAEEKRVVIQRMIELTSSQPSSG